MQQYMLASNNEKRLLTNLFPLSRILCEQRNRKFIILPHGPISKYVSLCEADLYDGCVCVPVCLTWTHQGCVVSVTVAGTAVALVSGSLVYVWWRGTARRRTERSLSQQIPYGTRLPFFSTPIFLN